MIFKIGTESYDNKAYYYPRITHPSSKITGGIYVTDGSIAQLLQLNDEDYVEKLKQLIIQYCPEHRI